MSSCQRRADAVPLYRPGNASGSRRWFIVALTCVLPAACQTHASQFVRLDYNTSLSSRARDAVFLELFDDRPVTQANFMEYVNSERYDGSFLHRLSRNFVISGGGYFPVFLSEPPPLNVSLDPTARVDLDGNSATPNPTIPNEASNAPPRPNVRGTLAMSRVAGNPNSATSQWFVNLANNPFLDTASGGNFTVFGQVLADGMAMFDHFNSLPIANLNPDHNNDGIRDSGPFGLSADDGVPFLNTAGGQLVEIEGANRIDYLGAGSASLIPAEGLTFSTRDTFIDSGAVFAGTGPIIVGAGRTLGIREGTSLGSELINQGALEPGLQLGAIMVESYRQETGATLEIQLLGTAADTQYDQLLVSNGALLGGDLNVSLLGGFIPELGDHFNILIAGSLSGTFDDISLPPLVSGLRWDIQTTTTSLVLAVVAVPEPSAVIMILAANVLGVWRRRRIAPM
jgi:cyclophilin family peptidyl-prolyl cis-trans isomerase